jgi:hypothetical protein
MRKILLIGFLFLSALLSGAPKEKVYLFSYFRGNGEDGLHLAYSRDGYNFTALNNDMSFLTPSVGVSKLMRDPCVIRTDDGIFHMVWTAGWTERGIGYSSSKDLINWTDQKYLMVMEKEPTAKNTWAPEIMIRRQSNSLSSGQLQYRDVSPTPRRLATEGTITGYILSPQKISGHYQRLSSFMTGASTLLMQQLSETGRTM